MHDQVHRQLYKMLHSICASRHRRNRSVVFQKQQHKNDYRQSEKERHPARGPKRKPITFKQFLSNSPVWLKNRSRHAMHKILSLFKKDEQEPPYPWELERHYRVSNTILGTGSFAVVRECTDKETNQNYALKIILKSVIKGKENMLTTELDVLKKVDHPHVVRLHDLYESKSAVYIITDLAYGGELFNQLLLKGSYTERDASVLIRQILEGVVYLHDHEIVHRDLKPENLLFKDKSEDPKLMITDFGLSKILTGHNDILMTACGTPGYVAPEVLSQTGHGKPVDIWSIGIIAYAMLCGYTPFYGEDQGELFENIIQGSYEYDPEYWSEISDYAKDLISKMLARKPEDRITARDALDHPWFEFAAQNVDLLRNVRTNFSARATFKKAITAVQGINRLRRGSQVQQDDEFVSGKGGENPQITVSGVDDIIVEEPEDDVGNGT